MSVIRRPKLTFSLVGLCTIYLATYIIIRVQSPYYELKWPDGRVGDEGLAFGFPREAWGNENYDFESHFLFK